MKISVIGANGMIGQRIVKEALSRGHEVTAIARDPTKLQDAGIPVVKADATDAEGIAAAIQGQDVLVSSYGTRSDPSEYVKVAEALVKATKQAGVRLIVVGGAGSLEVAPGVQLVDTPEFPAAWKSLAMGHRDGLEVVRKSDADWTYLSPAALIEPGERTGKFRLGGDQLVVDGDGNSKISAEDYAVALVDEIENPKHRGQRFTLAY
jgi:putative NADH-flavin reductase